MSDQPSLDPPSRSPGPVPAARRPAMRVLLAVVTALALIAVFDAALSAPAQAESPANGVSAGPPMGWSSWDYLRFNVSTADIEAQAAALKSSGLLAAGYNYVNIDDGWYDNPATTVDGQGYWVPYAPNFPVPSPNPNNYPNGIAALAAYVHSLGEKFGLYLTPGVPVAAYKQNLPIVVGGVTVGHVDDIVSNTTQYASNYRFGNGSMYFINWTGSATEQREAQDFLNNWADELASWGVDYLKADGISPYDVNYQTGVTNTAQAIADVAGWSKALNQSGRPIRFELSNNLDQADVASWQQYSNGWRIDADVDCYCPSTGDYSTNPYPLASWGNVASRFTDVVPWIGDGGPGGWNDLDDIEVGNGPTDDGLTDIQAQTQITLWAVENAPMLIGPDLTNLNSAETAMLTNKAVIGVDQAGHPARPIDQTTQQQAWTAPDGDGTYTVALFNLSSSAATVSVDWPAVGFSGSADVKDLWSGTDDGTHATGYSLSLPADGSALLKVTPTTGSSYTNMYYDIVSDNSGKDLAVSGSSGSSTAGAGAGIVQEPADGGHDQEWQLVPTGSGTYKIVNRAGGQVLDVPSGAVDGTQLVQNPDDNAADSQWQFVPDGSGGYTLKNADGLTVDDYRSLTAAGTEVDGYPSTGNPNQHWKIVPVPDPGAGYRLANAATGGRTDVHNDSTADGATILQSSDDKGNDQLWSFVSQSGGVYTIANDNSGLLLNIPGSSTKAGTQLIQYQADGYSNSQWTLVDAGPNRVEIKSQLDGQVIDLSGGSTNTGTAIEENTLNGATSQMWTLIPPA